MALPVKKFNYRKETGFMEQPPDLLSATRRMDLKAIKECLENEPACINQVDEQGNNAMHICIGGGTPRMKHIMEYFVSESDIDLLHENNDGRCPLELAIAINDVDAIELLEEPTHIQLTHAYPDTGPDLTPVS